MEAGVIPTGDKGSFHFWKGCSSAEPSCPTFEQTPFPTLLSSLSNDCQIDGGKESFWRGDRETSPQRAVKLLGLRCQSHFPTAESLRR